jgi:DNA-binding response OmpR family regulator
VTADDLRLDGLSILVLEDEYILAEDAARVLLRAGAAVVGPFETTDEVVAAVAQAKPDCAIVDLNLGAGLDFGPARALRALGVPLVLFSGYDEAVLPADFRGELFLQKPIHMPSIVDSVAQICGRSRRTGPSGGPWRGEGHAATGPL